MDSHVPLEGDWSIRFASVTVQTFPPRALVAVGFAATRQSRLAVHSSSFHLFPLPVVVQARLFVQPQNLVVLISSWLFKSHRDDSSLSSVSR
jgi:hypothetical protein